MSVKTFTELSGFKEENVAELESIGIKTVDDLREAIKDDAKAKEIVKTLSGVGPKTIDKWKDALAEGEKSKAKAESKPAKSEAEVKIVEDETAEDVYVPKAKPKLDEETKEALAKRAIISGRRPAFKRQEWFRYAKLGEMWRRPKGIHSKMKRNMKRRPPVVDIGFRGPISVRNLHPSGFEEVMVYNVDGLEGINPEVQAIRIGGTVGTKKRLAIQERADELGIRVLNRMV